jgi:hypothetical protein
MHRIALFDSETALVLTPRWGSPADPGRLALSLAIALIPLVLMLWLYRYELRLVSRFTAGMLLALRLVVVLLLLCLVGLQPVYAREKREELPGRVLLLIDRSDSMDVADPQRSPLEKLRLARALNLAGDLCSPGDLDDWISQLDEKRDIVWVKPDEHPNDPARRRELEAQRRKGYEQLGQLVDQVTRSRAVQRLLSDEGGRFLKSIQEHGHQIELLGFARNVWDGKVEELNEFFEKGTAPKEIKEKEEKKEKEKSATVAAQDTGATDLRAPLLRALELSGEKRGKILGAVVLTDGQHNTLDAATRGPGDRPETPVQKASDLGEQHVPLYLVGVGALLPPPDAAVLAVVSPSSVFKDVDINVDAKFRISGMKAQDFTVKLHRPGEEDKPLQERTIHHEGKDQEYVESFQVRMDQVGTQTLTATVKPVDPRAKETRTDNNSRSTIINVADDQAKVLLVDGEARWEFHYLATALQRDRTMKLSNVVFVQPRLGKIEEPDLKKIGNPSLTLPSEPDALSSFDCIILGDATPEQLPRAERVRLEKYVAERGGTLVILAGKRAMPLGFLNAAAAAAGDAEGDPLVKLLPIEQPREHKPVEGFPITLTPDGKLARFLQLEPEAEKNEKRWDSLPRHFWGVIGKAKPGATTLAYVASDERGLTPKEKSDREKETALIVRQNYGFGRVLYVGLDSTWRWRYRTGDTYHHRFWGQAIRWAASDKPLIAGNDFVRFGTPQAVFKQGEKVEIAVRLTDEVQPLKPDALAEARILRKEGDKPATVVAVVPLTRRAAQPRVLEGNVLNLQPGAYQIELAIPDLQDKLRPQTGPDGKEQPMQASFSVTAGDTSEMIELGTNWKLLEELAVKNGTNRVYTPETANEIVTQLLGQAEVHVERRENRLWQWWVTLVLVLALLTFEWVGRKWAGLP